MLGSLPAGMVDIAEEMRREDEELRKLLFYEGEGPISKSLHGNPKTSSKSILTESGSTSSTGQSIAEACKAIHKEFNEFMVSMGKRPTLTSTTESCIDLVTSSSLSMSPPAAHVSTKSVIPSSPVSVAEAPSNGGNGGHFLRISQSVNPPPPQQTFATAAWKPKEPPCFFGRSTEDAHTWVSLVRNYLAFMSGSDSQQVAYTVTLFREAAHEWYMSFERRNRGPPRDWASLVSALLDGFGSNIRSQEAQSQLMSISQGQRLCEITPAVRDAIGSPGFI